MKALSIQQPWAWLIVNGIKDVENRNWKTNYKGFVLIHAGKQVDGRFFANDGKTLSLPYAEHECGTSIAAIMPQDFHEYERGGIVGYAHLTHTVTASSSWWFQGPYGFVLTHRHPVDLLPLRGQLGLFDVPAEISSYIEEIRDQRAWEEDAKDMAQIKREWRNYRLEGDEIPGTI
jgi:hypothetical protein